MKRWKKLLITVMLAVMCLTTLVLTGCGCGESYHDEEIGDFHVRFYSDYCAIKGTTEQGNAQRFLVIPEYIKDVRLGALGVNQESITLAIKLTRPDIQSDIIEKVYFANNTSAHPNSLSACTNSKKVMFIKGKEGNLNSGGKFYYPYKVYKRDYPHVVNYYNHFYKIPANVSYYYNYENSENDGYYWIDDYDYGGSIEYTPKDPIRDGYTFGGWYKEAECISKWSFAIDKLPEKRTEIRENNDSENEEMMIYQETILYAKWL